jgi:hypothetical protein
VPLVLALGLAPFRRFYGTAHAGVLRVVTLGIALIAVAALIATGRLWPTVIPQSVVYVLGSSLLLVELAGRSIRLSGAQALALASAGGPAVGWFLGSNGGIHSALMASPLVLLAALSFCLHVECDGPRNRRVFLAKTGVVFSLVCVVAAAGMLYTPEGLTRTMTTRVDHGPFKGIRGTLEEVRRTHDIWRALQSNGPADMRTVYLERFPLGYLTTMERPGTYSTWATSADSPRLQSYVDRTGIVPGRIVLTKFAFAVNEDGVFPEHVELRGYQDDYAEVFEDENIRILERRE